MDQITRRSALGAVGGLGAAALLGACGGSDGRAGGGSTTASAGGSTSGSAGGSGGGAGGGTGGSTATTAAPGEAVTLDAALFDESAACAVSPEQVEGPYWFDVDSVRRDVREDRDGVPLRLGIRVRDAETCDAVGDAVVEIWHCDADGIYSGFEAASLGGTGVGARGGRRRSRQNDDTTYLRGAQITDGGGIVEFLTVFPGWYRGRTAHIHVKVHVDNSTVLTSQLYFPDELAERIAAEDYAGRGSPDTTNAADGFFDERTVVSIREDGDGYLATINLDVDAD